MRFTDTQGHMAELSPGKHPLEIRNLLGRVTGEVDVDIVSGRRQRCEWRRRNRTFVGEVASSTMPPPVDWDAVFGNDTPNDSASGSGGKKK